MVQRTSGKEWTHTDKEDTALTFADIDSKRYTVSGLCSTYGEVYKGHRARISSLIQSKSCGMG